MTNGKRGAAPIAAAVIIAVAATAQAVPWPRLGLVRDVGWGPASLLTIGNAEHGAAGLALTFRGDAAVGVVLQRIAHRGTRNDGQVTWAEYLAEPPAGQAKGPWHAVLRPESSDAPFELTPAMAAGFEAWTDPDRARDALFAWTDLTLPGAPDSRFWFELRVTVDAAPGNRAVWLSRMGRVTQPGTERWSVDEVHAPILYARHVGDVRLSRILVPAALNSPLPVSNMSMWTWQLAQFHLLFDHPARHQQMQFSALYCGDPTQAAGSDRLLSGHRKLLYVATEDAEGWFKRFRHDVVADATGAYYRWAPIHFPRHPPSPWRNTFTAPYPVVTSALQARTDAWWYDAAAQYRDFVRRDGRLVRIDDPACTLNRDFAGASLFMPCSTVAFVNQDPADVFVKCTDEALRLRGLLRDPAGAPPKVFMEWQKWLEGSAVGSPYPAIGPEDPIGPGFNPLPAGEGAGYQHPTAAARAQIARAHAGGVNVSTYLLPPLIQSDHWTSFRDEWFLRMRNGDYHPVGTLPGRLVDFGPEPVAAWYRTTLFDDVLRQTPQLGGLYLDTLGGQGSYLRYEPAETHRNFRLRYHGGKDYVQGVARTLIAARQRIAQDKGAPVHPNVPFVLTEAVQEGLAGTYDFAQHGYKPLPMQLDLNQLIDQFFGVPPQPDSSAPSPPLWNLVYHEWSRAEAVGLPLNFVGVAGALGGGQHVFPGLTWTQWADYQRVMYALPFVQGMNPFTIPYFYGLEPYNLLAGTDGSVTVRDPANAAQVQLVDFLRTLFGALARDGEAGQFLRGGVQERPLQMPTAYSPASVSQSLSPSTLAGALTDGSLGTRAFYEDGFTTLPYPMAHVLHTVWRRRADEPVLGLVFVNWSDLPAAWEGTFDPSLYAGLGNDFVVEGLAPAGTGVTRYAVGQGSGATVLAWHPAHPGLKLRHHSQAGAGFLPPRSVQVLLVR
jgi:hypothetical protein